MKTFTDDIKYSFIPRYGALAQIIILNVVFYLTLGLGALTFYLSHLYKYFSEYVLWLALPSDLSLLLFRPWTLLTYGFLHYPQDVFHILFNMLWMFWIGQILVQYISERNKHVWSLYIGGVLGGAILYLLLTNGLSVLAPGRSFLNGASAGVTAIVVGTAVLVPNVSIYLFLIGAVRLKWVALAFVLLDVILIPASNPGGRIAHLGGALFGFLYISQLQKGNDWGLIYDKIISFWKRSRKEPVPKMRVVSKSGDIPRSASAPHPKSTSSARPSSSGQEEIDRILDKIQAVGYENLTREEKQTLFNAGKE